MESVTIPGRFNGPEGSGHGGTSAGLLAGGAGMQPATVTLYAPPPLDVELVPHLDEDGAVTYSVADRPIASVAPTGPLDADPFPLVDRTTIADAVAGMRRRLEKEHPYPTCFGCGNARPGGDGLELMAGPVDDLGTFGALWTPADIVGPGNGQVPVWMVWAALDCPSGYSVLPVHGPDETVLLGRFAVDIRTDLQATTDYRILARPGPRQGRRIPATAAAIAPDGTHAAVATAVWVTVPRAT